MEALVHLDVGDGLLHLDFEQVVGQGLDDKVQGGHLVATDGVLGHAGEEDEAHVLVHLPQASGRVQSVHVGHDDIHKDDLEAAVVLVQEGGAVAEHLSLDRLVGLGRKAVHILQHLFGKDLLVLYNGNGNHPVSLRLPGAGDAV